MTREIKLNRGLVALIDDADFERVSKHSWKAYDNGRGKLYVRNEKQQYLHRFLLDPPPGMLADHRNGDGLDCRRKNIRVCNSLQNRWNARTALGVSGFRGVHPSSCGGWRARLGTGDKYLHLGVFQSPVVAALARDKAARLEHGDFALLNFPHPEGAPDLLDRLADLARQDVVPIPSALLTGFYKTDAIRLAGYIVSHVSKDGWCGDSLSTIGRAIRCSRGILAGEIAALKQGGFLESGILGHRIVVPEQPEVQKEAVA